MLTTFNRKKILVIDDEARLAQSLTALLCGAGYDARAATSGPEGLQIVKGCSFDLVISDLRMEGVDGFDLMHYVAENCPNTALILITGHASTESAIEALHQRVADYITKPFDFDLLRGSIERVFLNQDAEKMRKDLVAMLTHDIKAPLTNVLGFAQLIIDKEGNVNPDAQRCVNFIVMNSQRILTMLDNYLTNTRLEEGRLEIVPFPVDVDMMIEEALTLLSYDFNKKNISVRKEIGNLPEVLMADEHLLARAISNLLGNAAKYTPGGGETVIRCENGERFRISVANSGSPLSKQETEEVFDRYKRARTSRGIEGSGLGLHVVRCIAEAHGGSAWCESEGNWTTFFLEIPASQEA